MDLALSLVDRNIVDGPKGLSELLWMILDKGHTVARYPRTVLAEAVACPVATEGQVDDQGVLSKVVSRALGVDSQFEVGIGEAPMLRPGHAHSDVTWNRPTTEEPSGYELLCPLQSVDPSSLCIEWLSIAAQ